MDGALREALFQDSLHGIRTIEGYPALAISQPDLDPSYWVRGDIIPRHNPVYWVRRDIIPGHNPVYWVRRDIIPGTITAGGYPANHGRTLSNSRLVSKRSYSLCSIEIRR